MDRASALKDAKDHLETVLRHCPRIEDAITREHVEAAFRLLGEATRTVRVGDHTQEIAA